MDINNINWAALKDFMLICFVPVSTYFVKIMLPKIVDERLQLQLEQVKHQNKRSQFRYELYTQKQHEVLLNIHQLYGEAKGYIAALTGLYNVPDFTNYTVTEFNEWLARQTFQMLDCDKAPIYTALQIKNYQKANELINNFIITSDYHLACNKLIDAHNYFLSNKIYIPVKLTNKINELDKCLNEYLVKYCKPERLLGSNLTEAELQELFVLKDKVNFIYNEMTDDFRNYLETGDI